MPVTNRQIVDAVLHPFEGSLRNEGITVQYLAKKLKRGLEAKVTKSETLKGAVDSSRLPRGMRCIAITGQVIKKSDGSVFATGHSLIEWDEIDWPARQEARIDAQKLLGLYLG